MDGAEWRIGSPVSFGLQVSFGLPSVILSASEESRYPTHEILHWRSGCQNKWVFSIPTT